MYVYLEHYMSSIDKSDKHQPLIKKQRFESSGTVCDNKCVYLYEYLISYKCTYIFTIVINSSNYILNTLHNLISSPQKSRNKYHY